MSFFQKNNVHFLLMKKNRKKQLYTVTLFCYMYIFLLPKCKVNTESYSDHAAMGTQQSDIKILSGDSKSLNL